MSLIGKIKNSAFNRTLLSLALSSAISLNCAPISKCEKTIKLENENPYIQDINNYQRKICEERTEQNRIYRSTGDFSAWNLDALQKKLEESREELRRAVNEGRTQITSEEQRYLETPKRLFY